MTIRLLLVRLSVVRKTKITGNILFNQPYAGFMFAGIRLFIIL